MSWRFSSGEKRNTHSLNDNYREKTHSDLSLFYPDIDLSEQQCGFGSGYAARSDKTGFFREGQRPDCHPGRQMDS